MASAREIQLDEKEVIALAVIKTEQILATGQEALALLRILLAAVGAPVSVSRAKTDRPRSRSHARERDEQHTLREPEEGEESEESEDMPLNGKGALLDLPHNAPLSIEEIDDRSRYTVNQVAEVLHKSAYTIRSWISDGKIDAERVGNGKGQFWIVGSEIRRHADEAN